jgi:hypothetical protein
MDEDGVIPFFVVFGWEATLSIRDERQENWDKLILEKIVDELVPHRSRCLIPSTLMHLNDLFPFIPLTKHERG